MKKYISIVLVVLTLISCTVPALAATTHVDTSWVSTTSESDLGGAYACMYKSKSVGSDVVKIFYEPTSIQIRFNQNSLTWVSAKCGNTTGYMHIDQVQYTKQQLRKALFGNYAMQRGFEGQPVANLQLCLKKLYYDVGAADGIFGSGTEREVKNFQLACKLENDGIAGTNTQNALIDRIYF